MRVCESSSRDLDEGGFVGLAVVTLKYACFW